MLADGDALLAYLLAYPVHAGGLPGTVFALSYQRQIHSGR